MMKLYHTILLLALAPLVEAATISVTQATNIGGTADMGALTVTEALASGGTSDILEFTISGFDADSVGGNNDSAVIQFTVTAANALVADTATTGWFADNGGGFALEMDTVGDSVGISFTSLSVNLNGGTNNGSGSFLGFSAAKLGSWNNSPSGEEANLNGSIVVDTAGDTFAVSGNTVTYTYDADSSGSWRALSHNFSFTAVPEPSSTALIALAGATLVSRRCRA